MKIVATVTNTAHVVHAGGDVDRTSVVIDLGDNLPQFCITTLGVSDDIPLPLSEVESEKCVRSLLYKRFHDLKNYALKM